MKLKLLTEYLLESSKQIDMKYYCFDWDDNILHMPTKILMDKKDGNSWRPEDVSTAEFTIVRNDKENYRIRNNDATLAFSEFRDFGRRGNKAFIEDTIEAIEKGKKGPSWNAFIKCLSEASLFAIITARGHEPQTIRAAVEWIIDNVMTEDQKFKMYSNSLKYAYLYGPYDVDKYPRIPRGKLTDNELIKEYLDNCSYYGVSSNAFAEEFGSASASNPEAAKQQALDKFLTKCNELGKKLGVKSVSIGFSDDDPKNVEHMKKFFHEKTALIAPTVEHDVELNIYSTVDPKIEGGERTKFTPVKEGQSSYGLGMQTRGMDSSVLPFSSWNSMTKNLYPATQDAPKDDAHNHFKNKLGQIGDLTKDVTKKTKRRNEKSKRVRKLRK